MNTPSSIATYTTGVAFRPAVIFGVPVGIGGVVVSGSVVVSGGAVAIVVVVGHGSVARGVLGIAGVTFSLITGVPNGIHFLDVVDIKDYPTVGAVVVAVVVAGAATTIIRFFVVLLRRRRR